LLGSLYLLDSTVFDTLAEVRFAAQNAGIFRSQIAGGSIGTSGHLLPSLDRRSVVRAPGKGPAGVRQACRPQNSGHFRCRQRAARARQGPGVGQSPRDRCHPGDLKTSQGHRRIVHHGHLPEREVMTGIGPVRQPRVRDHEVAAADPGRIRFTPGILPPYVRRSKSVEACCRSST
jgi:hypothetical protein